MQQHDASRRCLRRRRRRAGDSSTFNVTGILDIGFLLLIFFVLTAVFAYNEGVLPGRFHGPGPAPPRNPLTVDLKADHAGGVRWIVDERIVIEQPRRQRLARLLADRRYDPQANPTAVYDDDNTVVVIRPEGRVPWDDVVQAYDAAIEARYAHVSIAQTSGVGRMNP